MAKLSVQLVPCLKDNYAYLVSDAGQGVFAVVDPSEADPVIRALGERKLTHILNTHHHFDHTGGNLALKERYGAQIVGPEKDRERIPGIDVGVSEDAPWMFGKHVARILEIPAHTKAHIAFYFPDDGIVFTGDTLFAMGCGRLFEGTPEMMSASLAKLTALPDETRVYCGHEYTFTNGRFAVTLEPNNSALHVRLRDVEARRARNEPTMPTNMALEKRTNPFLRTNSAEIRRSTGLVDASDVDVFAEMRRRKDMF